MSGQIMSATQIMNAMCCGMYCVGWAAALPVSFQQSNSGRGGPIPGLPPLYADPHIFTHPYQPSQYNYNHSCLHIPPPPTSIDNIFDSVPDDAIVVDAHLDQFRQRVPLDHLSDISTQHHSYYIPFPYHTGMHYAHDSISFYSLHGIGSTESDGSLWPIISDSVRPYYEHNIAPFSPPPIAQGQGGPGGHPAAEFVGDRNQEQHRRDFEAGRIDYTGQDRFSFIQQHLDSVRGAK